ITAVRVGDIGAYEELYRRHVDAAMAVGRHLTGSKADAEDVVSEAFARVLSVLQRGAGPEMAFRPYLLTSVRNAFYDRTRKDKRLEVTDDVPEDLGRVLAAAAASDDDAERQMAATAFASLPERWQLVLWHTEVEGRSPAEVGPLLGLAPNAVAALAYRAREGLRQAYLNAHIQARPPAGCEDIVPKLGAYVRHDLSNRDRQKVEAHLEGCERCRAIVAELEEAGSRLRVLLIPIIAGIPAAAYLSGIGAPGAGGLLAAGSRTTQRVKEMGPAGQVAVALGAVAAAGLLVVGAVAAARSLTGGGPQQTVSEAGGGSSAGSGGSGSGGGGGGGSGSAGGSAGTTPSDVTPGSNAATQPPSATDAPVISPTSPAGSGSGSTSGQPPIIIPAPPGPSAPATNAPPATSPSPTSPATTAPVPPPTTAPPASLSVSLQSAGPAYAGLGAAIPVTVGNDTSVAVALGPGRSVSAAAVEAAVVPAQAGPAVQPTVTIPLAPGVTFDGVDNPEWACTAAGGTLSCVLPALDPGATTAGLIQLGLPANATGTITLQPTIADGSEPPVMGPPLVLTVLPPPTGLSDLVIDHADLVLTGNGILTCDPAGAPFCVTARDDPAAAPAGRVDKSGQQMVWIDVDGDPATFNSSSADLSLPPDSTVLSARLLWGGTVQPGPGGSAPPSPTSTAVVQVTAPGGVVQQVTAPSVSTDPTSAARYVAAADVAALVAANGAGTYTVADLQTATGPGAFGGWALQVVYRDPAAPLRMVATTDQVATVTRGGSSSLVLSGLTPPTAAVTGTLSYAAVEGDYGIVPEQVAANGVPLSNAVNAPDNPMNGSISTPGARNPTFVNNFGFDVDLFPIDVAAGSTEVRIDVTSSSDRFRVAATGVVIPL
ncbi:MAG TPA: sigma-70 family RNA polymerase sigma factor, partial [Acidimicrobiales bacterium]